LIAGKGHEKYQEFADKKIAFDDSAVARRAIEAKRVELEGEGRVSGSDDAVAPAGRLPPKRPGDS
jgi:hypothetical protein